MDHSLPVIWIIDNEHWPRACLRAELIERGYDAIGHVQLSEAAEALRQGSARRPELIILELRRQELTDADVKELRNIGVPLIVLAGSSERPDTRIQGFDSVEVLSRPLLLGDVADRVDATMRQSHSRSRAR